jgi:D-amino-acid dehydrogenase
MHRPRDRRRECDEEHVLRVMICTELTSVDIANVADDNVVYRPDLTRKAPAVAAASLARTRPDALIVRERPSPEVLGAWRRSTPVARDLILIEIRAPDGPAGAGPCPPGIEVERVEPVDAACELEALRRVEAAATRALARQHRQPRADAPSPAAKRGGDRVAVCGAGIINLITAFELALAGYRVSVLDAAPDPRAGAGWRSYGCTFGGCDARIFSLNEGRHHHFKGYGVTPDTNTQFLRPVIDGGWLAVDPRELGEADAAWIEASTQVPPWLMARFDRDITSFNQESWPIWRRYLKNYPKVFADTGFHDRLLRLYSTERQFKRALQSEDALGAIVRQLDRAALATEFPSLQAAVAGGHVAGAIEVLGFAINVHRLGRRLVTAAEQLGVAFRYDCPVVGVERDGAGQISAFKCPDGAINADHYVVSAGAYADGLLNALGSACSIAPIIGMWLTLPDTPPYLDAPLKIARSGYAAPGAAEGANVIAGVDDRGRRVIHLSAGHGYIGIGNARPDPDQLATLARAVKETAQQYFPTAYAQVKAAGELEDRTKHCVRPWTPHGLGLFGSQTASGGGRCLVTGGHNTGGFAQSPSVAKAVLSALAGQAHPMHRLYHPRRFAAFASELSGELRLSEFCETAP